MLLLLPVPDNSTPRSSSEQKLSQVYGEPGSRAEFSDCLSFQSFQCWEHPGAWGLLEFDCPVLVWLCVPGSATRASPWLRAFKPVGNPEGGQKTKAQDRGLFRVLLTGPHVRRVRRGGLPEGGREEGVLQPLSGFPFCCGRQLEGPKFVSSRTCAAVPGFRHVLTGVLTLQIPTSIMRQRWSRDRSTRLQAPACTNTAHQLPGRIRTPFS